jgi:hypothetical protein
MRTCGAQSSPELPLCYRHRAADALDDLPGDREAEPNVCAVRFRRPIAEEPLENPLEV